MIEREIRTKELYYLILHLMVWWIWRSNIDHKQVGLDRCFLVNPCPLGLLTIIVFFLCKPIQCQLFPKYLSLYPQTTAALTSYQSSFFLQQINTITVSNNWPKHREKVTMWLSNSNYYIFNAIPIPKPTWKWQKSSSSL